jgi:hypothetical protein
MNCTHGLHQTTVRTLAFALAASLFAGCGGANHMVPTAALPGAGADSKGGRVTVQMQIRIPRRSRGARTVMHPATISALTRSVGIVVNGGGQQVFNTTPSSPACAIGASGMVCTFAVQAKVGTDTFVVTTFSSTGGAGTALDRGVATVPIAKGKANDVAVRLGPVVTTTADSGAGSLRYAIGGANSGDTIMFLLPAGSTIALSTPIDIAGNVSLAGPGAASPVTISGGNTHQIFAITGNATISGLTLTQGKAATPSAPGGAIFNTGTLTLANDTIGASTSIVAVVKHPSARTISLVRRHPHCSTTYAVGGALYNDGSLTITGTTFNANVVQSDVASCIDAEGGAIYNDIAGTLSSTGDTFTNNSAMIGGAVYNGGYGQVSFTSDTFTANTGCNASSGCPTSGCTSAGCMSFAQGIGAAIADGGSGITVVSSQFTNNVAGGLSNGSTGEGGALALTSGNPTVTGSVFSGNLAGGGAASCSSGQGGAIAASVVLELDNDQFTNNQAIGDGTSYGGALANTLSTQGSNDTFGSNVAVGSGSACSATSTGGGGAIYDIASLTFTNSTFTGNAAEGNSQGAGGALACGECLLTSDTFASNSALGTGAVSASSTGAGGAIYSETLAKVSGSVFTGNAAAAQGPNPSEADGGAVVATTGIVILSRNAFTSNSTTVTVGTGTSAGGAVALIGGTILSSGDTFNSNAASGNNIAGGGAAYINTSFVMSGATFTGNTATGGEGVGGALAIGPPGQISNSTFTGNTAKGNTTIGGGGAIYDSGGSAITNSTIAQNIASTEGGGILALGTETILDSTITANQVTTAATLGSGGGGIYDIGGITMVYSTVSNNAVTVSGAGTSGGGGIFNGGGLELLQSTISGNAVLGSAPISGGGGIASYSSLGLINDTITGNSSKLAGGGIQIAASATVTAENVTLFENTATGAGGNLDNGFLMTLSNSIVAGGTAATGGDIDNTGTLTSGDYNIIQTPVAGTALAGTTTHNKAVDPLLLALSNNGGTTFTNADQAASPGKAYIPFSGASCGTVTDQIDQRGYTRGAGALCDVGAFEYGGVPTAARHHVPSRTAHVHVSPSGAHVQILRLHPVHFPPLEI